MRTRRALVIGGSLGGLLAAHLLRNAGLEVVVFERNAEDLTGRGAGIGTHPELVEILRRVGIAFDKSMGIEGRHASSASTAAAGLSRSHRPRGP